MTLPGPQVRCPASACEPLEVPGDIANQIPQALVEQWAALGHGPAENPEGPGAICELQLVSPQAGLAQAPSRMMGGEERSWEDLPECQSLRLHVMIL